MTRELDAERRARQEAEAQAAAYREVLKHCLLRLEDNVQCLQSAGYYNERDVTQIAAKRAHVVLSSTDIGKQYLAIVEAARRWKEAIDNWHQSPENLLRVEETADELYKLMGGTNQTPWEVHSQ